MEDLFFSLKKIKFLVLLMLLIMLGVSCNNSSDKDSSELSPIRIVMEINIGETQDLTELLDTSYEFRCQCDFEFGFATQTDDTIVEINRVSGSGFGNDFDVNIN